MCTFVRCLQHSALGGSQTKARPPHPVSYWGATGAKSSEGGLPPHQCCCLFSPELRSYAQTLLEFLRRAEEFFRTQIDFSFLTRSLPQFMLQVYRHLFPAEAHQDSTGSQRGGRQ